MDLIKFLKFSFGVLLLVAGVNMTFDAAFDYLQRTDHIVSQTADGFTTWQIVREPVKREPVFHVHPDFHSELKKFDELAGYSSVTLLVGSSVVAAPTLLAEERFSSRLSEALKQQGAYFFNGGIAGSEVYTEFDKIQGVLDRLPNVKCVIWFPNINDFISRRELSARQNIKEEARSLGDDSGMSWQDRLFFGFYKRLAQKIGFEQNLKKEKSINSSHQLYYTNGLKVPLGPEVLDSLREEISSTRRRLESRSIAFAAVFLPSRHFNLNYEWKDAKSFQDIAGVLSELGAPQANYFSDLKGKDPFVDYVHFDSEGHRIIAELLGRDMPDLCRNRTTN